MTSNSNVLQGVVAPVFPVVTYCNTSFNKGSVISPNSPKLRGSSIG